MPDRRITPGRDGDISRGGLTGGAQFTQITADTLRGASGGPDGISNTEDLESVEQVLRMAGVLGELGATGLKHTGGYIDEEFLPQLRGRKAVGVFKEMSENDPLVGAILFSITMLLRRVEWTVKPGGKSKQDSEMAKFVESCMDDMEHTWDEFITEVLSFLPFGWAWHEVVYKRRLGAAPIGPSSKHSDGMIGWRKLPIRAQETWMRWVFDDAGDVRAMVQMAPPRYHTTMLPIERSLLFRFRTRKNNPEGSSLLRNAYRPWYFKKRIEEFEAIGVERDLAGLPMVKVPAEYLRAKPGSPQHEIVKRMEKMVKGVRRNEQEGLVFPVAYDQDTKQPLFDFSLLASSGGRQFQTDAIIQRYEQRILMSVLADFIMVGHQSTGSYSLHTDKTGIFRTALNSIAQTIADVLNRTALPRLMRVNGYKGEALPTIEPTDVDSPDINQLSAFMASMAQMGVQWFPDPELEKFVRDAARLPQLDEDSEDREARLQERAKATQFMAATADYLETRNRALMAQQPQVPAPGMAAPGQEAGPDGAAPAGQPPPAPQGAPPAGPPQGGPPGGAPEQPPPTE